VFEEKDTTTKYSKDNFIPFTYKWCSILQKYVGAEVPPYQLIGCTLLFIRFVCMKRSKGTIKEGKMGGNMGKLKIKNRNHPPTRSARNEMG
jgi:hypothetical protein